MELASLAQLPILNSVADELACSDKYLLKVRQLLYTENPSIACEVKKSTYRTLDNFIVVDVSQAAINIFFLSVYIYIGGSENSVNKI